MAWRCRASVGLLVVSVPTADRIGSGALRLARTRWSGLIHRLDDRGSGRLLGEPMVCPEPAGSDPPRSSVAAADIAGRFGYAGAMDARISRTT